MRFLGIDIGYDRCGVCIIEYSFDLKRSDILFAGSILTDRKNSISNRLKVLGDDLISIKNKFSPDYVSIEKLFFNRKNSTFEKICMSKGIALMTFSDKIMLEIEPKRVKKAIVGNGDASKSEIKMILGRILGISLDKTLDDTVDAICLALYHIDQIKLENMQLPLNSSASVRI